MTRDELFKMFDGDADKMQEAIDAILANIKPAFVTTCLQLEELRRKKLTEAIQE